MGRKNRLSAKMLIFFGVLVVLALAQIALIAWKLEDLKTDSKNKDLKIGKNIEPPLAEETATNKTFNKALYSVSNPSSIWVVVNKGRILPANFVPSDLTVPDVTLRFDFSNPGMKLRRSAANALEQMITAAAKDGIYLRLVSGYRSYNTQISVYNSWVEKLGKSAADRESARPGHSEHQTGLAADVGRTDGLCDLDQCFADTAQGKWTAGHAYKYGFIIRYPKNMASQTGYAYEPWHLRYVGKELAAEMRRSGQTLEQFFNLPSYNDYPEVPVKL